MVPNLGYKKDTFLEPSLISNFLSNITISLLPQPCLLTSTLTNKFVTNLEQALLRLALPLVRSHGRTASFAEAS